MHSPKDCARSSRITTNEHDQRRNPLCHADVIGHDVFVLQNQRGLLRNCIKSAVSSRESVERLAAEREQRLARGETVPPLALLLCEAGLLDRAVATTLLTRARSERASERPSGRWAATPGQTIGPYELMGELGRGGMGRVYRARHIPTGAIRALKVMSGAPDPESVVRFRREAEAVARVGGRGVVAVHETGVDRGRLYFAMALVPRGSLRARLQREGKIPWRDAVALAVEVALVLERCHSVGLIHRDVKPDNVLLDEEGRPWLSDFGCVRDLGASRLTETGTGLGTLSYMAPEQLRGEPADAHADVYSLAVTLHELVSGTRPFHGLTGLEQLAEKAKPCPRLAEHGAPEALDRAVDLATGLRPSKAAPSAADFARDLGRVLEGRPVETRLRRRLKAVGALVLVGAAAFALFLPSRASPTARQGDERSRPQDPFERTQALLH
jgi:hypothetical protein